LDFIFAVDEKAENEPREKKFAELQCPFDSNWQPDNFNLKNDIKTIFRKICGIEKILDPRNYFEFSHAEFSGELILFLRATEKIREKLKKEKFKKIFAIANFGNSAKSKSGAGIKK